MHLEDLQVQIAGIRLEHPVMNAAGTCKGMEGEEGVKNLARSATLAIVVGSATAEQRSGNMGNVYFPHPYFSLNSLGLPNPGIEQYRIQLPDMVACAHDADKPLFFSVAGFSAEEYAVMAEVGFACNVDLVELNLGCPNIWEGVSQKRIACFDLEMTKHILQTVSDRVGNEQRVSVKISPMSDPVLLEELAKLFLSFPLVKAIASCNTFPNALTLDESFIPLITPAEGLAGFAGSALKPIALGQVRQLKKVVGDKIDIIGVGGINAGKDVREFLHVGACCTQVATAFMNRGIKVFGNIIDGLLEE